MMTKEEYKKTIIRMWDTVRDDVFKGESSCNNVCCDECPINFGCGSVMKYHELVEFVEQWAKEHPIETNGSRFSKNYPKAVVYKCDSDDDGFVYLGLDCTKPFNDENGTKFPKTWWESEAKEHLIEINGSKFLKNYPKADIYGCDDEFIYIKFPFSHGVEDCAKIPKTWWESEVDDANCD